MTHRRAKKRLVIVGAGGQARELSWYVAESARTADSPLEVVGFVLSDLRNLGPLDSRDRVLGDYDWLREHRADVDALALGIGNPTSRLRVARELATEFPELDWPIIVHPSAVFDTTTLSLGRGVTVGPGVVGTVNVVVEEFAMLNFGASVGHEARVGAGAVVNPGARISGGVTIGSGTLVGAGAVVLQYLTVGAFATIGAGAVVTHDVAEKSTVTGVPARPISKQ